MIPVYKPYKASNTKKYLSKVVDDNWYSHGGYFYDYAKAILKDRLNVEHVLLTNNGTTATHLLAKILKNKMPIKNIVTQNGSYVAAWNAFLFDNDMTITMNDLDLDTWNVDTTRLAQSLSGLSPKDTAVLLVHNIGNPVEFDSGNFLAVEDNCEGLFGKYYGNRSTGTQCLASSVSFFANKNITCGEGGAIITNDEESYEYALSVHGQGQSSKRFVHDKLGYNYRMTNLAAAVLCSQLEQADEILDKKKELFDFYRASLGSVQGITFQRINDSCQHSNWMFGVRVENSVYDIAEKFYKSHGVEIRPMFYPASAHSHIRDMVEQKKIHIIKEDVTARLNQECIILPSYPDLLTNERQHIINVTKDYKRFIDSGMVTI